MEGGSVAGSHVSACGGVFSGRGDSLDVEAMASPQWLSVGQAGTAVGPPPHFSLSFGTGRKQGLGGSVIRSG